MSDVRQAGGPAQVPFEFAHEPSHAEADFMAGESNRLALAHIRAFPNWPGPLTLVTGPAKAGKSHLGRIWRERAGARLAEPAEIEALASAPEATPLLIEDVDRAGYEEAALFHLLNRAMRDRRPVLMTARAAIADWPYATDDLRSRARLATHVAVAPADDVLLAQMLVKLFGDRQVTVDPRIIGYIVPRMERSAEEAVALVALIDRVALGRRSAITRAVAAEALAERARSNGGAGPAEGEGGEDE